MLFSDFVLRLGFAFLSGTLIGLERQYRQRVAGLRTNILVAIGAGAFTILSYSMTEGNGDPTRISAQIVSGIGFIGGGLILKDGFSVRGLNTAATIWCSAACGTLSGVGLFKESMVLVAGVLITHCLFRPLCNLIERSKSGQFQYTIRCKCNYDMADKIQQLILNTLSYNKDIRLNSLFYRSESNESVVICEIETVGENKALLDMLISRLRSQFGVHNAGWERKALQRGDF